MRTHHGLQVSDVVRAKSPMPGPRQPIRWSRTPDLLRSSPLDAPDYPICISYQANYLVPEHNNDEGERVLMVHRVSGPTTFAVKSFRQWMRSRPDLYETRPGDFQWFGDVRRLPASWPTPGITITGWFFDPFHHPVLLCLEVDGMVTASPTWWQGSRWLTFQHEPTTSSWILILGADPMGIFLLRRLHPGVWRDGRMRFMLVEQKVGPAPLVHDDRPIDTDPIAESFWWYPWGRAPEIVHVRESDRAVAWCAQGQGHRCRFKGWAKRHQSDAGVLGFRFKPHDQHSDPDGHNSSAVLRQYGVHCWSVMRTLTASDAVQEAHDMWASSPSIFAVAIHADVLGVSPGQTTLLTGGCGGPRT